jgi:hypothetical protein
MRCPYFGRQADPGAGANPLVPGTCGDRGSGISGVPGFWHYWNRCTTDRYFRCPLYRRHQRGRTETRDARLPMNMKRSA